MKINSSLRELFILVPVESKYQNVLFLGESRTLVESEARCNCTVTGLILVSRQLGIFREKIPHEIDAMARAFKKKNELQRMNQMLLAQWHVNTWILWSSGGYCVCLVPSHFFKREWMKSPNVARELRLWIEGKAARKKGKLKEAGPTRTLSKPSLSHKWSNGRFLLWPLGYFIMRKLSCSEHQDLKFWNFTPFPADPAKHDAFCSMRI